MGVLQSIRAYFHKPRTGGAGYSYALAKYNQYGQGVMDLAFFTPYLAPDREYTGEPASWVTAGARMMTLTPNSVGYALQFDIPQDITGGAELAGEPSMQALLNNFYLDEQG